MAFLRSMEKFIPTFLSLSTTLYIISSYAYLFRKNL